MALAVALVALAVPPAAARPEAETTTTRIAEAIAESERAQRRGDLVAAQAPLEEAWQWADRSKDPGLRAAVLAARGHLAMALRSPTQARALLETARREAEQAEAIALLVAIDVHVGNSHALDAAQRADAARREAWTAARAAYRAALARLEAAPRGTIANEPSLRARALANRARASAALRLPEANDEIERASAAIARVRDRSARIDLLLHLADTAAPREADALDASQRRRAHALASEALSLAEAANDERARGLALLTLARSYRADGQREGALALLERAVAAATRADDPVMRFRGWLASAELHREAGHRDAALTAYAQALDEAELLRPLRARSYGLDPSLSTPRLQSAHLDYVDLLLQRAAQSDSQGEADLALAQRSLERQKAQELRDYFDDECVDAALQRRVEAGQIDPEAALIYPIALADRLELVVTSPKGRFRTSVPIPRERLRQVASQFRQLIEIRSHQRYLRPARELYDWLIRPIEQELAAWETTTLVFVPDAVLRALPMAALHDGEQFLVERFALATTPGLDLTVPRPLASPDRLALAGGLSVSVEGFASLPFVEQEIEALSAILETDVLLNESFTPSRVERGLSTRPISVVHVATHARFDSKDDAFVLTHDGRISMSALSDYLAVFRDREEPLELLMLSACETAAGDDDAAMGLAGLAVQSGARSAIGTLWVVNDSAASEVAERFYRGVFDPEAPRSRAVALAEAQRALIGTRRHRHPAYWAPFLLIGGWL